MSAPQNPQATTVDADTIDLSWDPPQLDPGESVVEYRLYRATSSGTTLGDYTHIDTVAAGTTTYTDDGLRNGEAYFNRVTAVIETE